MSIDEAAIAANRFGLGARPGELKTIAGDPRGWLKAQLKAEATLPAPLAALPSSEEALDAFAKWGSGYKMAAAGKSGNGYAAAGGMGAMTPAADKNSGGGDMAAAGGGAKKGGAFTIEQSFGRYFTPLQAAALAARFEVATTTDKPYFERLVHFWGNHFAVSNKKLATASQPEAFERDVARANAIGHFEDMLLASSKHPTMLLYLDNYLSVGPNSELAKNPVTLRDGTMSPRGLNENLAREIMELHTMGVRSGYTQIDVTNFAKIITGWMISRVGPPGEMFKGGGQAKRGEDPKHPFFTFYAAAHEPGPQTLMGKVYDQTGVDQGNAALHDIAHTPQTASFIATKLARHFIADDPPKEAVERIAKVFRDTGGNLKAVCVALVDEPEAWKPQRNKMKPPEDFLVSAVRSMGGPKISGFDLLKQLNNMGQLIYDPNGPDGWADVATNWIGADAIWKRLEWSVNAAKDVATTSFDPAARAAEVLGSQISTATLQSIQRAESPVQGLALLLVSPEFQRR